MIQWLQSLLQALKIKTVLIAFLVFILGNFALNYSILSPGQEALETAQRGLERMKETYVQLKTTDMSGIAKLLEQEVDYLNKKREKIFSNLLSNEQIPILISRLERVAEGAGLGVRTDIVRAKNKKPESPKSIVINLNCTGTIEQISTFFSRLESWDEILLVQNFKMYSKNSSQNTVTVEMQFFSLVANE